uniref:Protein kinase domain-containing protein n=1 Tax=Schistosoma mansoni TaxID=6183 RepID=A0A3Q0KTL8_SCHMA
METLESMLKAVRDFLSFLEQNKQSILNISSVPPGKFHPVSGCSECITSLPPTKNDYVAQTPIVLLPKLNENPDIISRSFDIYCRTSKSSKLTPNRLNIPCSVSSELYSWCPVGLQVDGDCCLAGIERKPNQMSCRFVVTNRVSCVSENGQIVCTEDNNIYYLRGGFSWTTFCALHPMLLIDSPPPGIVDAFSNGFPAHNWRSWTQGLHYFISTASEGIKEPIVVSSDVQHINMPNSICANRLPKENQYKRILNSTNRNVDLDSFVGNTFRDLEKDLEIGDPVKTKGIQTNPNHIHNKSLNNKSKENHNHNNNLSMDSFSHFTSVSDSNQLITNNLSKKFKKKRKFNNNNNNQYHKINKSIKQKNHFNKNQLRHLLTNHQSSLLNDQSDNNNNNNNDDDDNSNIDERYRLYTASGEVVDVRQLNRTRSGRIVLPKLDSRYEQSVVLNGGHVMGVSRNTDDQTLISWVSESSSQ